MSDSIVRIQVAFDPDMNFWDMNPHMVYIPPFNELHATDNGGLISSRIMWCVVFICHPDEEENKFFRFGRKRNEEMLMETFHPELNVEDELYNKCLMEYPLIALSSVQRDLYNKKMHLRDRAEFLSNQAYTLDTGEKLDRMHSKTAKIMEEYDEIYEKYLNSKRSDGTLKGGRRQSKSEKREV